jgi:large repetitive protein
VQFKFQQSAVTLLICAIIALLGVQPAFASDLQLSDYSWSPDPIGNGAETTFSIRSTNNGPASVGNAVVTVTVSDRFEVINAAGNFPGYCTLAGAFGAQTLTCSLPSLGVGIGNSQTFTFKALARQVGSANTTASITAAGNTDSNASNNALTITPAVVNGADLSVTKVGSAASIPAGGNITYTLTPRNAGPNTSAAVRVIDSLPAASDFQYQSAGGTNWSCSLSGITVTCNYTGAALAVPANYPAITITGQVVKATAGTITNIASIQSTDSQIIDSNAANNSSGPVVTTITAGSEIQPLKTMPASILVGQNINITLRIRNNGPQAAPAGTVIADTIGSNLTIGTMPSGCTLSGTTVSCTAGALASGAEATFLIPVAGAAATSGVQTNSATLTPSAGFADANLANNTATAPYSIAEPNADLAVLSKIKGPTPVAPGAPITNTITIRNQGPSVANYTPANPIRVTDAVTSTESYVSNDAAWSCSQTGQLISCQTTGTDTLAVGSNLVLSLVTQSSVGTDTNISNTACTDQTASSSHTPSFSGSPTANDCVTSVARSTTESADLSVVKDVSLSNSGGWTDNLSISNSDTTFYIRLRVTNNSGNTARTVNISDTLPNFLSGTFTTAAAQDSVTSGSMTYTASSGLVSWTVSNLAVGTTQTLIVRVSRPFESGTFTNTASVSSPDTTETNTANNTDTAAYTVAAISDMTVNNKVISPNPARVGVQATYVISVRNDGANAAAGVVVEDTIDPARFAIIGTPTTTKPGATCSVTVATGLISCAMGTYTRGQSFQINAVVRPLYPFGGSTLGAFPVSHTNRATVQTTTHDSNGGADANAGNNFFDLTHNVETPSFDLAVSKAETDPVLDDPIRTSETLNYDVRISNFGPSRATNIVLTDIPAPPAGQTMALTSVTINPVGANSGLTLQSAPNAACNASGATYICKVDPGSVSANFLDPLKQVIFRMVFTTGGPSPSGPITFTNEVQLTSAEHPVWNGTGSADSQTTNNRAVQTTTMLPTTDLEVVSKTRNGALVRNIGEPVSYTIRIRNNGPTATTQVRVTDVLPTGFVYVATPAPSVIIPGGSTVSVSAINCSGTGSILCVLNGTFPAGAAELADITLTVRADHPYTSGLNPVDQTDTATIAPGLDINGDPISEDSDNTNNSKSAAVRIQQASIAGNVYADNNRRGNWQRYPESDRH